jgi:aspartokinase
LGDRRCAISERHEAMLKYFIQMISTSEVKVSCVVDAALCDVVEGTLRKTI